RLQRIGQTASHLSAQTMIAERHDNNGMPALLLDQLRGMAQLAIDRLGENPVQLNRMAAEELLEALPAKQGNGRVTKCGDVGKSCLLQDHAGFADRLTRADFVV